MSDLRLNYSQTSFDTILGILDDLVSIQNNDAYEIRRWGKTILDYGLKQGHFDKTDSDKKRIFKTSERQFKSYKHDLVYLRLIREYDKKDRVKGGTYYSISPLGLLFYYKFQKSYSKNSVIKMFEFFDRIAIKALNKYFKNSKELATTINRKSWNYFNNEEINMALKIMFENIVIESIDDKIVITFYAFNPTSLNKTAMTQMILLEKFIKIVKPNRTSKIQFTNQGDLEFGISFYSNLLASFYLILYSKKSKWHEIPKEFKQNFYLLSTQLQEDVFLDFSETEKRKFQLGDIFKKDLINKSIKLKLERLIRNLE